MSETLERDAPRVLVIGAQGVLGSLVSDAFARAGWSVLRGGRRPVPFPPEPFRTAVIQLTRNRIAAADRNGRRGIWLRTLDRLGLGFDS